MKLLILHLSDFHFFHGSDPGLQRAGAVVAAVRNMDYELDRMLLVLSGDMVFSGDPEQFSLADDFLTQLIGELRSELSNGHEKPVDVVIVPGNHDCDFSGSQTARELLLEKTKPDHCLDDSVVEFLTSVQEQYRQFAEDFCSEPPLPADSLASSRLIQEYAFGEDSDVVRVVCCNTAWMSRLEEKPGTLLFPEGLVPARRDEALTVAVLHHPYNWLEPENARGLRSELERLADLVLTGHEHDTDLRPVERQGGVRVNYIEGNAFQAPEDKEASAFNAIVVDTSRQSYKFADFRWVGERYSLSDETRSGSDGRGLRWSSYAGRQVRPEGRAIPKKYLAEFLEDPGATFRRESRQLHLQDIFVAPDLVGETLGNRSAAPSIPSSQVLDFLSSDESASRVLITGDEQSGKTTLAKMLFQRALKRGCFPILVRATDALPAGEKLYGALEDLYSRQYDAPDVEVFRQESTERRLVILDDYQYSKSSKRSRKDLLKRLCKFSERVVVLANDITGIVDEIFTAETLGLRHFRLQPFGHRRRQELIERWLLLGAGTKDASEFARRVVEVERTVDIVIGRNFVPAHPVFLLSILQAFEDAVPVDISAGTHGYYYELLIRNALAQGRSARDLDVVLTCLSTLGYRLLQSNERVVDESGLLGILLEYEKEYDVSLAKMELVEALVRQRVLRRDEGGIGFRYPYLYYYFVALHLRDRLQEEGIRESLSELASNLDDKESANIFLFMAHLTRDPIILDHLLAAADETYSEYPQAELKQDIEFLGSLAELASVAYEDRDPEDYRRQVAKAKDERLQKVSEPEDSGEDAALLIRELGAALRKLQILGQVLKNFPGSLPGESKDRVAGACYALGRRVLSRLLSLLRGHKSNLVAELIDVLTETKPGLDKEEVKQQAEGFIVWHAVLFTFGLVKRVSQAVGAPELEITFKKLLEGDDAPVTTLIDTSIGLDGGGGFPGKKVRESAVRLNDEAFAAGILKLLVREHFYMFPVKYSVRQSICAELGIDIRRVKDQARQPRMLKEKRDE